MKRTHSQRSPSSSSSTWPDVLQYSHFRSPTITLRGITPRHLMFLRPRHPIRPRTPSLPYHHGCRASLLQKVLLVFRQYSCVLFLVNLLVEFLKALFIIERHFCYAVAVESFYVASQDQWWIVRVGGATESFAGYACKVSPVKGDGPYVGGEGVGEGKVFMFVVVLDWMEVWSAYFGKTGCCGFFGIQNSLFGH